MVIFKAVVFPFVIALLIGCLYSFKGCFTERDSSAEKLSDQGNQLSALEPLQYQLATQVSFSTHFPKYLQIRLSSTAPFSQFHQRLFYITHLGNNVLCQCSSELGLLKLGLQLSQNSADTPNEHQGNCHI